MRLANKRRRGMIAVIVAVCLIMLLGFVALALDGGMLLDYRRRVQSAADTAALAAADDLYANWRTNQGLDPQGTAAAKAQALAAANGFSNAQVNIPPLSGYFAGKAGYAEVIITYNQPRYFSSIYGSATLLVSGRAVAAGRWAPVKMAILVLNPTASGALTYNGSGTVTVSSVPAVVDSSAPDAAVSTGGGTVIAPEFDLTGAPGNSGGGWVGNMNSGQTPVPDPLKYLAEPDPDTLLVRAHSPTTITGTNLTYLQPGVYEGGISVTGQGLVVLAPGVYYMDGGGFSFGGQGGLWAPDVTIFNAPKVGSDVININGNGPINIAAPTSGSYQGIALWQQRSATNPVTVTGNGGTSISGTFYAAHGTLNVTGNGTNDVLGSQYISYNLVLGGNGSFAVNWSPEETSRTRIIGLVE